MKLRLCIAALVCLLLPATAACDDSPDATSGTIRSDGGAAGSAGASGGGDINTPIVAPKPVPMDRCADDAFEVTGEIADGTLALETTVTMMRFDSNPDAPVFEAEGASLAMTADWEGQIFIGGIKPIQATVTLEDPVGGVRNVCGTGNLALDDDSSGRFVVQNLKAGACPGADPIDGFIQGCINW